MHLDLIAPDITIVTLLISSGDERGRVTRREADSHQFVRSNVQTLVVWVMSPFVVVCQPWLNLKIWRVPVLVLCFLIKESSDNEYGFPVCMLMLGLENVVKTKVKFLPSTNTEIFSFFVAKMTTMMHSWTKFSSHSSSKNYNFAPHLSVI